MGKKKKFVASSSSKDTPGNTPADTPKTPTALNAISRPVATATTKVCVMWFALPASDNSLYSCVVCSFFLLHVFPAISLHAQNTNQSGPAQQAPVSAKTVARTPFKSQPLPSTQPNTAGRPGPLTSGVLQSRKRLLVYCRNAVPVPQLRPQVANELPPPRGTR